MHKALPLLVVEDDDNDLIFLRSALTREGINHCTQVVPDGGEAIAYLNGTGKYQDRKAFPFPDIILTDLKMPRGGGFELLQWLREHQTFSNIPVVVFSGSRYGPDVDKAYKLGAKGYLAKTPRFEDLRGMLRSFYNFWSWCEKPSGGDYL